LRNNGKPFTFQKLTLEDETPNCGPHFEVSWTANFPGSRIGLLSPFEAHDSPLERSFQGLRRKRQFFVRKIVGGRFPKKRRLGPQNGSESLGPEKLLKIVNCAIIKETEKLKEIVVGVQIG